MTRAALAALVLGLLATTGPGCGAPPSDEPLPEEETPESERFRAPSSSTGYLVLEEGTLRFQPCGATVTQPVDDLSDGEARRLVEDLGHGEDRIAAAVVLEGMRLLEVRHAAGEARTCEDLLPGVDLEARGNEPFWSLEVQGEEARWRTPDELDGIVWSEGEWRSTGEGRWQFEARRGGPGEEERLLLDLESAPCRDTMAGFRFPYIARLDLAGIAYEGCALEGHSSTRP